MNSKNPKAEHRPDGMPSFRLLSGSGNGATTTVMAEDSRPSDAQTGGTDSRPLRLGRTTGSADTPVAEVGVPMTLIYPELPPNPYFPDPPDAARQATAQPPMARSVETSTSGRPTELHAETSGSGRPMYSYLTVHLRALSPPDQTRAKGLLSPGSAAGLRNEFTKTRPELGVAYRPLARLAVWRAGQQVQARVVLAKRIPVTHDTRAWQSIT
jgi:hypothetical protein